MAGHNISFKRIVWKISFTPFYLEHWGILLFSFLPRISLERCCGRVVRDAHLWCQRWRVGLLGELAIERKLCQLSCEWVPFSNQQGRIWQLKERAGLCLSFIVPKITVGL